VKKQLGRTWIEVNHEVLMFVVEDEDHPQIIGIQAELQILSGLMHDMGTCLVRNLFCTMWKKKIRHFISVAIA